MLQRFRQNFGRPHTACRGVAEDRLSQSSADRKTRRSRLAKTELRTAKSVVLHPLLMPSPRTCIEANRERSTINPRDDGDKKEFVAGESTK